jgi:hypothetical protein
MLKLENQMRNEAENTNAEAVIFALVFVILSTFEFRNSSFPTSN